MPAQLENHRSLIGLPSPSSIQKYAGTLQLQEGRKALLSRLAAGDRRPVRYTLRFPAGMPLPTMTRVHTMGKDLCRVPGDPSVGPGVTTTISLEHSVRPEPLAAREPALYEQQPPSTTPRQGQGTVKLFLQADGDTSTAAASASDAASSDDDDEGELVNLGG